jgi:hypothetical protein
MLRVPEVLQLEERVVGRLRGEDRGSPTPQVGGQNLQICACVIDDQDLPSGEMAFGKRRVCGVSTSTCDGECERERRALAGRTHQADFTTHQLYQLFDDRQAEPGAAESPGGGAVGLGERREQLGLSGVRNADAGIAHLASECEGVRMLFLPAQTRPSPPPVS